MTTWQEVKNVVEVNYSIKERNKQGNQLYIDLKWWQLGSNLQKKIIADRDIKKKIWKIQQVQIEAS